MPTRYAATVTVLLILVCSTGSSHAAGGSSALGDPAIVLSRRPAERAAAVSPNMVPVLDQPVNMTVAEGTTAEQSLGASDGDGQPLHFFKVDGPSYLSVSSVQPASGEISENQDA